jgi:glucose-1-phosphate thymidylyltransferase
MKGLLLAGGRGTRLHPATRVLNKHLLPIVDRPMIYYSLSTLMLAGVRDILVITNDSDVEIFRTLLDDGSSLGLRIEYAVQHSPRGIAEALLIGRAYVENKVCLALGDNLFLGRQWAALLSRAASSTAGATAFSCKVDRPELYGALEFDGRGRPTDILEKPQHPPSPYIIPGVYFYDHKCVDIAKNLRSSPRGELEITDVNRAYLKLGEMEVIQLPESVKWYDAGTPESILTASQEVFRSECERTYMAGCLEETALKMGFITGDDYLKLLDATPPSLYRNHLEKVAEREGLL